MTDQAGSGATRGASSPTSEPPAPPVPPSRWSPALTVSVILCAYSLRRWEQIERAVGSVLAQRLRPHQVILVIDHNDALLARAVAAFPEVTVVANSGPRGLSGARNTGVARARGEIIAFLDDDAEADSGWLSSLARHYGDQRVAGAGGWAEPVWENSRPRWFPPEFDWVVGCSYTGQPTAVAPVRNLIGCNMSFRRDALHRTGGFAASLGRIGTVPVGCEETELCIRLRRQDPQALILHDPGALVRHSVTPERGTWAYFRRRCLAEGRSKAVVARTAGAADALSTERTYASRVLVAGVRRELGRLRVADVAAPARIVAIISGLLFTATGYLPGRLRRVRQAAAPAGGHRAVGRPRGPGALRRGREPGAVRRGREPRAVRTLTVELSTGVPEVPDDRAGGGRYDSARALIRLHGDPVGVLDVAIPPGGLTAAGFARAIGERLMPAIRRHLRDDGRTAPATVPVTGLGGHDCSKRAAGFAPPVSVVVTTAARPAVLAATLDSLCAIEYPQAEILVVDNRPDRPGTAELVAARAERDRRIRYVAQPRPGVAAARNLGVAQASCELIAFLDDDVVVDGQWLTRIVAPFADPRVAAVTGHVLAAELETPAQVYLERYGGFGKGCALRRFHRSGYDTVADGEVHRTSAGRGSLYPYLPGGYGTGANMAMRAGVLRQMGGFDPAFGVRAPVPAGEDIDLLLRTVLGGHVLVYQPAAVVWHRHHRQMRTLRRTLYRYGVGLSAVMTKCLVAGPADRLELLGRLPRGVLYACLPSSAKNAGTSAGYPRSLKLYELAGMAFGAAYYLAALLRRAGRPAGAALSARVDP